RFETNGTDMARPTTDPDAACYPWTIAIPCHGNGVLTWPLVYALHHIGRRRIIGFPFDRLQRKRMETIAGFSERSLDSRRATGGAAHLDRDARARLESARDRLAAHRLGANQTARQRERRHHPRGPEASLSPSSIHRVSRHACETSPRASGPRRRI